MERITTARAGGGPSFLSVLMHEVPPGLLLNLGAGVTGPAASGVTVVNVDHAVSAGRVGESFVVADASSLPFRNGAFNAALAKDVFEHLPEPIGALRELSRVMTVGAPLIATVPRAVPRAVWDDPTHVRGFTARSVKTALDLSGWHLDRLRRIGGFPGAGRLGLVNHLERIMTIPIFGHWFGLNWLIRARTAPGERVECPAPFRPVDQ